MSKESHPPQRAFRWHWSLVLIACLGLSATLAVFLLIRHGEEDRLRATFERIVEDRFSSLARTIEHKTKELKELGALFETFPQMERRQFHQLVKKGFLAEADMQALEWIPRVPDAERKAFEEAARRDGFAGFRITERQQQGVMVERARRAEYFPVYYVEPHEGNEAALGFDVASNPTSLEALNRARDSGEPATTGRIILVQEQEEQPGFLIFQPVYQRGAPTNTVEERRAALQGFALGGYRVNDLIAAAMNSLEPRGIDLHLYDQSAPEGTRFLHFRPARIRRVPAEPRTEAELRTGMYADHTCQVADRQWVAIFTPAPAFLEAFRGRQSWGVPAAGLVVSGMLTAYVWLILARADQARRQEAKLLQGKEELEREIVLRKGVEAEIAGSLREKELLLKEIHHRVKNNLQIVSSLLNLQSGFVEDQKSREMFMESRTRVQTMALLHEKLYQSPDLTKINFAEYVQSLTADLFDAYRISTHRVALEIRVEVNSLDLDLAIPCGLIICELISNCLKHAFPKERTGKVEIGMRRNGEGGLTLAVSDNGVGFPQGRDFCDTESLGLQLVNSLVMQLDGAIELHRNGETEFRITFAEPDTKDGVGATNRPSVLS